MYFYFEDGVVHQTEERCEFSLDEELDLYTETSFDICGLERPYLTLDVADYIIAEQEKNLEKWLNKSVVINHEDNYYSIKPISDEYPDLIGENISLVGLTAMIDSYLVPAAEKVINRVVRVCAVKEL